jgi:hypothetical protein
VSTVKATLFCAFLLASPLSVGASQDPVVIPVCEECEVHLERVVTLRDPTGRAWLSSPTTMARTRNGYYLVVPSVAQYGISVFSPAGSFVRRIGTDGDGPGEFRSIVSLSVGPADSVFIWDAGSLRMTVLTPAFDIVRDLTIRSPTGRVIASGRGYFGTGLASAGRGEALPLQIFDDTGALLSAFGGDGGAAERGESDFYRRSIATAPDGTLWSARLSEYVLERWDSLGHRTSVIRRNAPWFPPRTRANPGESARDAPPPSLLVDLATITPDTVWTLSWAADPEWRDAVSTVVVQNRRQPGIRREDRGRYRDTVFERMDVAGGRVIGHLRVDEVFSGLLDPDEVYHYEESETGEPVIHVYRLVVERG